ncbi:hypothetical protein EV44_g5686 [Erysiphe necator]|uniref:Uncharacterized protein n=1 Tax=Uncinula necator TaxID=52586 RepID=A0A0B1PDT2_UNCNE|nr:hypothetical protein EV44_g5686 [Erysiphe necator]
MSNQNKHSQIGDKSYNIQPPEYSNIKLDSFPKGSQYEKELEASGSPKLRVDEESKPTTPLLLDTPDYEKSSSGFSNSTEYHLNSPQFDQERRDENKDIDRNVYLNCLGRYLITLFFCIGYVVIIMIWENNAATSAFGKRVFKSIITGISIGLSLNISGSFKEIALTMRWSLIALKKFNLDEIDLLLQSYNLITFYKLARVSRRPLIKICCIFWILVNILTQFGLASLSLTHNFDGDTMAVHLKAGRASIAKMSHFFPRSNHVGSNLALQDEQYTAHTYGGFALTFGIGLVSTQPTPGQRYQTTQPLLWLDKRNNLINFVFLDSPKGSREISPYSAYTDRKISVTYKCDSYSVLAGGDGTKSQIEVESVGTVILSKAVPESTTYLTRSNLTCEGDNRCSVVEVFESSDTDPWYYICKVSLGQTQNDPLAVSKISDKMAQVATASIAQIGYTDSQGFASQVYPRQSLWGQALKGDSQSMGMMIGIHALASIAGAAQFNPFKSYTTPHAPAPGFRLKLKHKGTFISILTLINLIQLGFVIIAIVLSKKGKANAWGYIDIIMLFKPITDTLPEICLNEDSKESRKLKSQLYARYEKSAVTNNDWNLKMYSKRV